MIPAIIHEPIAVGRSKKLDRPQEWAVYVPQSTCDRLEPILNDPLYDKPIYGARGKLINRLLLEFLDDIEQQRRTFDPVLGVIGPRQP